MSRTMPWGGVYKVTADIGVPFGLTLDDITGFGELDDPLATLYGSGVGIDITEDVQEITINRGRQTQLDQFSAGTCTITLFDQLRKYDPANTISPYYNPSTQTSGVTIRRSVRVFYDDIPIFTGRITDLDVEFDPTSLPISRSKVTIEAADGFVLLANTRLEEFFPIQQLGGARISALLALPEVNYTDATELDSGTIILEPEPIDDQTVLLDYLQAIADTEQGYLFMRGNGALRFSNRIGKFIVDNSDALSLVEEVENDGFIVGSSAPFLFADDGTGDADYATLSVLYGQEQLYNRIVCTPVDSLVSGIADDATSQSEYGVSVLNLTGLLCSDDDAQVTADYLLPLFKEPEYRFDSVSLSFAGTKVDTATQLQIMLLDLGSVIRVKKNFAVGNPSTLTQTLSIEGISHSITPTAHQISFSTTVRDIVFFWTLDDPSLGRLDHKNAVS